MTLTRAALPQAVAVEVAASLGFVAGTTLRDAVGGASVVVPPNGMLHLAALATGARVLSP